MAGTNTRRSVNRCRVLLGLAALLFVEQGIAHHSGAMFDDKRLMDNAP